ncbi:hypothetical protein J4E93_006231 [Alternaria ventricosa]|uniref:uncharacterized protein n=1 Tax=Alternaria ventricosa TaxID=1187951 RepID=UPI0020C5A249|nr:uncharacterized protein J4E93_006231 [Alternaria ventricosa]KAI4644330.1 hypothetical protein J4E93_006231 [Alternaria ventricosa]
MINGPSDVVDEGTGSGCGDAKDGISVGAGGVGTASDVDAVADAETTGGGTMDEEGCTEDSAGGAMDEDAGDGCAELESAGGMLGAAEDDSVGVGAGISDVRDGGAGSLGVGSATSEDELASTEDEAAELGMTGSGTAEETGISGAPLGSGVAVGTTVVYDVTITTGGTWRDADGDTSAGGFDGAGMGVPATSDVEETSGADS